MYIFQPADRPWTHVTLEGDLPGVGRVAESADVPTTGITVSQHAESNGEAFSC